MTEKTVSEEEPSTELERGQLKHLNPSPDYRSACFARRYFLTADPGPRPITYDLQIPQHPRQQLKMKKMKLL